MTQAKQGSKQTHGLDAIALLKEDHTRVKNLFEQFEAMSGGDEEAAAKDGLVKRICAELMRHAQIEEEVFYPAVRKAIDDDKMMDEAEVEHASAEDLIIQLEGMEPGDDQYDAKVMVLREMIEHHVAEEEEEMFPKAVKAKVDTAALGEALSQRKQALREEMAESA